MNQKDYKKVAEIINVYNDDVDIQRAIAIDLADYFKEDDNKLVKVAYEKDGEKLINLFDKKQFLKDCGV